MPSPFPGMDLYLEGPDWSDFHFGYVGVLAEQLVALLRPRYLVRRERRVYIEQSLDNPDRAASSDLAILRSPTTNGGAATKYTEATQSSATPVLVALPEPVEVREPYVTIRDLDTHEVITWIEVLSPTNKRSGADGRRLHLEKRRELLASRVHLVEIDLLRAGLRLPTAEALPTEDYYAFVCRSTHHYRAEVYAWTLRQSLPCIQVPLRQGDQDAPLDLQLAFDTQYDRAGYDYSLNYQRELRPPFDKADEAWAKSILAHGN